MDGLIFRRLKTRGALKWDFMVYVYVLAAPPGKLVVPHDFQFQSEHSSQKQFVERTACEPICNKHTMEFS